MAAQVTPSKQVSDARDLPHLHEDSGLLSPLFSPASLITNIKTPGCFRDRELQHRVPREEAQL